MTEEEIKKLEIRKELNEKELTKLKEITDDFEFLLDGEKDIFLKDLYYECLLTREEINELLKLEESEYSVELLKELECYKNELENLVKETKCDITKKL